MGKNRDRLSIVASILDAANSGASKTRIMFRANLSFKLLEKYMDSVVSASLVRVEGSTYFVTELGKEFLRRFKNYHERYVEAEKFLENLSSERESLARLCDNNNAVAGRIDSN